MPWWKGRSEPLPPRLLTETAIAYLHVHLSHVRTSNDWSSPNATSVNVGHPDLKASPSCYCWPQRDSAFGGDNVDRLERGQAIGPPPSNLSGLSPFGSPSSVANETFTYPIGQWRSRA